MKKMAIVIALWLSWGFALGTLLLLGPVRSTVDYARAHGWGSTKENMVVIAYILVLIVVSMLLAFYSTKVITDMEAGSGKRWAHILIPPVLAVAALIVLLNPSLVNADSSGRTNISTQFTIGPYPDRDKMRELKREGFTALVTLLHPAVVPFEPKLLNDEKTNAKKVGLEVISIPMLPWVSDNEAAIDSFRNFISTANGKYYIHCYLGKDRVNVARRIIEQENGGALDTARGIGFRSLDTVTRFERGRVYKLDKKVYLSPMPTKEEYIGYVVATDIKQVVALTDPAEPEAITANEAEEKLLRSYKIPYKVFYVSENASDERVQEVVDSVKQMQRPLFIHGFSTDEPLSQRFLKAYNVDQD